MSKGTIGGERLGSGNKMSVHIPEFDRTTVDLGYIWRSTMASGTLVPFMKELALPGDTHEITLNADTLTHPTIGIRRFLERWRKKHKRSVKHWFITELGHQGTENIHIHGFIWANERDDINIIWKYGFTYVGTKEKRVSNRAVNYMIKYITKTDLKNANYKPKILCSKGIGKGYLEKPEAKKNEFNEINTKETYTNEKGFKIALPIYYRNKLYTVS